MVSLEKLFRPKLPESETAPPKITVMYCTVILFTRTSCYCNSSYHFRDISTSDNFKLIIATSRLAGLTPTTISHHPRLSSAEWCEYTAMDGWSRCHRAVPSPRSGPTTASHHSHLLNSWKKDRRGSSPAEKEITSHPWACPCDGARACVHMHALLQGLHLEDIQRNEGSGPCCCRQRSVGRRQGHCPGSQSNFPGKRWRSKRTHPLLPMDL